MYPCVEACKIRENLRGLKIKYMSLNTVKTITNYPLTYIRLIPYTLNINFESLHSILYHVVVMQGAVFNSYPTSELPFNFLLCVFVCEKCWMNFCILWQHENMCTGAWILNGMACFAYFCRSQVHVCMFASQYFCTLEYNAKRGM